MDKILHHFETIGNKLFVGVCRGIIIRGLFWVVQDLVHPQ